MSAHRRCTACPIRCGHRHALQNLSFTMVHRRLKGARKEHERSTRFSTMLTAYRGRREVSIAGRCRSGRLPIRTARAGCRATAMAMAGKKMGKLPNQALSRASAHFFGDLCRSVKAPKDTRLQRTISVLLPHFNSHSAIEDSLAINHSNIVDVLLALGNQKVTA